MRFSEYPLISSSRIDGCHIPDLISGMRRAGRINIVDWDEHIWEWQVCLCYTNPPKCRDVLTHMFQTVARLRYLKRAMLSQFLKSILRSKNLRLHTCFKPIQKQSTGTQIFWALDSIRWSISNGDIMKRPQLRNIYLSSQISLLVARIYSCFYITIPDMHLDFLYCGERFCNAEVVLIKPLEVLKFRIKRISIRFGNKYVIWTKYWFLQLSSRIWWSFSLMGLVFGSLCFVPSQFSKERMYTWASAQIWRWWTGAKSNLIHCSPLI